MQIYIKSATKPTPDTKKYSVRQLDSQMPPSTLRINDIRMTFSRIYPEIGFKPKSHKKHPITNATCCPPYLRQPYPTILGTTPDIKRIIITITTRYTHNNIQTKNNKQTLKPQNLKTLKP